MVPNLKLNKTALIIVGGVCALVLGIVGALYLWQNVLSGPAPAPQAQATPAPALAAATAAPLPLKEPTATPERAGFTMRDAAPVAPSQQGQVSGAQQPQPVQPQPWSPGVRQTPEAAFSGQQSFAGPGEASTPTMTLPAPTTAAPAETPAPPMIDGRTPTTADVISISHLAFLEQPSYEMNGVIEYTLRAADSEFYVPVHFDVVEVRPDSYRAEWVIDPFDESFVNTMRFNMTRVGSDVFVEGDQGLGEDLRYENILLEFYLCEVLLCERGKLGFADARFHENLGAGSEIELSAVNVGFGGPLEALGDIGGDVTYILDISTGRPSAIRASGLVPLGDEVADGDLEIVLNVSFTYRGEPAYIEPPAAAVVASPEPVPTEVPVETPAVEETAGEDMTEPEPDVELTPVPPLVEVTDGEEGVNVNVLSYGYRVSFPENWFVYDASVFGNVLGSRIMDGLREQFAGEPQPHMVALDGFDTTPYIVYSQRKPLDEGAGLDSFSHAEFSRQTERKLLANRGWAVSVVENVQGYEGRLYRYETIRDTIEWLAFFPREHDVLQVLMEADANDGEDIDYDAMFRRIIVEMRFGDSIGDDGSRPMVPFEEQPMGVTDAGDPHVTAVDFVGETIEVRFSEPVWVSSATGVYVHVLRKNAAACVHPCDGSDGMIEFMLDGLVPEDVVVGFLFEENDGAITDVDGRRVLHEFTPYTRASYPVVVGTSSSIGGTGALAFGDSLMVTFSEPVWVSQGDVWLVGSEERWGPCMDCPVDAKSASRSLRFGWTGAGSPPPDVLRYGDFVFRLEGDGVVLSAHNFLASTEFDAFEIAGR